MCRTARVKVPQCLRRSRELPTMAWRMGPCVFFHKAWGSLPWLLIQIVTKKGSFSVSFHPPVFQVSKKDDWSMGSCCPLSNTCGRFICTHLVFRHTRANYCAWTHIVDTEMKAGDIFRPSWVARVRHRGLDTSAMADGPAPLWGGWTRSETPFWGPANHERPPPLSTKESSRKNPPPNPKTHKNNQNSLLPPNQRNRVSAYIEQHVYIHVHCIPGHNLFSFQLCHILSDPQATKAAEPCKIYCVKFIEKFLCFMYCLHIVSLQGCRYRKPRESYMSQCSNSEKGNGKLAHTAYVIASHPQKAFLNNDSHFAFRCNKKVKQQSTALLLLSKENSQPLILKA